MMKAVGAFAAAQLAFLPVSGAAPPRAVAFCAPRSEQLHGVDARAEILRDCILAHWAACCRSHMSPGAPARHAVIVDSTVNLDCDRLQARRWRPRASSPSRAAWTLARPCSRRCQRAPRILRRVRTATTRAPFHFSCRAFQSDGPARVSEPEHLVSLQAFRTWPTEHVELACLL